MYYKEPSLIIINIIIIIIIIITRPMVWMACHPAVIPGIIAQKVLYDWLTYLNLSEILLYMDACMDVCLKSVKSWHNHVSLLYKIWPPPPLFSKNQLFIRTPPPPKQISHYILTCCHNLYLFLKQS